MRFLIHLLAQKKTKYIFAVEKAPDWAEIKCQNPHGMETMSDLCIITIVFACGNKGKERFQIKSGAPTLA